MTDANRTADEESQPMRQITGVHIEADSICMKADDFDWALAEIRSLRQFHEWAAPQCQDHAANQMEIERLRSVLDWMLKDSQCDIWNGHFSQAIADTPEPLRTLVADEINRYRQSKGKESV